jgi:hypothetical protein
VSEAKVYKLALMKDGEIIATKKVRTDFEEGALSRLEKSGRMTEVEFAWSVRAKELLRDALHHEGKVR